SGFVLGEGVSVLGGTLSVSTPAVPASAPGSYPLTPSGLTATDYNLSFINGTLTITAAPLSASGQNLAVMAGAPYSRVVPTLSNADPFGGPSSYTATITWGDGHVSVGTISDSGGGHFSVSGSNTYAAANTYAIQVLIQHKLGYTTSPTTGGTATVSDLGQLR